MLMIGFVCGVNRLLMMFLLQSLRQALDDKWRCKRLEGSFKAWWFFSLIK